VSTAEPLTAGSAQALGARVRALREAMSLSLRDLAERSGVSAPMLSQVERGETSPTLQVAGRIAGGLELRLSQLLRLDEDGAVTIVRRGERRAGPTSGGHSYEILTPPLPGQRAELSRHALAPGAVTGGPGDPPIHEPGSRETALVETGALVLAYDGRRYELAAGDCVTFDADLPHHFENPGSEDAVLLAIVSAGLRRS
jgi:transcriptional regulator with XRE-family HTH domain